MGEEVGFTCFSLSEGKTLCLKMHSERIKQCYRFAGADLDQAEQERLNESFLWQVKSLPEKGWFKIKLQFFKNPASCIIHLSSKRPLKPMSLKCLAEQEQWPHSNLVKNFNYSTRKSHLSLHPEVDEILYFNEEKKILDSTYSSFFALQGNQLICGKDDDQQVLGVFRQRLIDCCSALGLVLEKRSLYLDDLSQFDQIFLTNDVQHLMVVKKICNGESSFYYKSATTDTIANKLKSLLKAEEANLCQRNLF